MLDDWRLSRDQIKYLKNKKIIFQNYTSNNPLNDHDHCEFCFKKFSNNYNDLGKGYSTLDNYIWICEECYKDFKSIFNWELVNSDEMTDK